MLPGPPERSQITNEAIDKKVSLHQVWINTNGKDGERADFSLCSFPQHPTHELKGATLRRARFKQADLMGIYWYDLDLSGANLFNTIFLDAYLDSPKINNANCFGSNFSKSDIYDACLCDSNFGNASFHESEITSSNFCNSNLARARMGSATLHDNQFHKADLHESSLEQSDLTRASFLHATLQDANLSGATLTDTIFHAANLRNADLSNTSGLQAKALGRSNVSGAKLPNDVAKFEGVGLVNQATENARKLFIALGLACAYAALAISTTGATGGVLELPIIGLDISVRGFYFVVPVLLLAGLGYFHLQMQRVWEEIARLPAVFPDGKAVDRKITPWLVTGIVRAHVPFIKEDPPRYFGLQRFVIIVLAWGLVPLTQGYFLYRFINAFPNEVAYSIFGALLVITTTIGAVFSYMVAKKTLREGPEATLSGDRDTLIFYTAETLLLVALLWQISYAIAS